MKKIAVFLTFAIIASCKKDSCETWEVMDYCVPKQSASYCGNATTHIVSVCGNDIELAHQGKQKVTENSATTTHYRKYLKKQ